MAVESADAVAENEAGAVRMPSHDERRAEYTAGLHGTTVKGRDESFLGRTDAQLEFSRRSSSVARYCLLQATEAPPRNTSRLSPLPRVCSCCT